MADKIKCVECEHCREYRKLGNERSEFTCKHPRQRYIIDYFENHRIQKMPGFIGFGERFKDKPSIKTSPAWCPKKAEVENGNTKH